MPTKKYLSVDHITVEFQQFKKYSRVLDDFSFSLQEGQIGSLIGGSGSGKSTLLRAIAGFEPLTSGRITLDTTDFSYPGYELPPEQRKLGMVFQDFALFPHLTVTANIESGITHLSKETRNARAAKELQRVGLCDLAHAYPHQLSGGQKQRVAIARALAPRPKLLLMDEPFSNLDPELRFSLRTDLYRVLRETATTCLMVTHDQQDAFAISDLLGVIHKGRLHQWSKPYDVYHHPADRLVADFVGDGTLIPGTACEDGVETELGLIKGKVSDSWINRMVDVLIRPEDLIHVDSSACKFPITSRVFRGESFLYALALPSGKEIQVIVDSHHDHNPGEMLGVQLSLNHLVAFPA